MKRLTKILTACAIALFTNLSAQAGSEINNFKLKYQKHILTSVFSVDITALKDGKKLNTDEEIIVKLLKSGETVGKEQRVKLVNGRATDIKLQPSSVGPHTILVAIAAEPTKFINEPIQVETEVRP